MRGNKIFVESLGLFYLFVMLGLFFFLISCVDSAESLVTYTIPSGSHYSNPRRTEYISKLPMSFYVRFDSSTIYDVGEDDINKLYGFVDCNSVIHQNSARIGWRWWDNQLQLFAYTYSNGVRYSEFLKAIPLNQWIYCEIGIKGEKYTLCVEDTCVETERQSSCDTGVYYKAYPYFGGNNPAPNKITIQIR